MDLHILHTEVQQFINNNLDTDPSRIALKGSPFTDIDTRDIVEQIIAKKKCKDKLPTWYNTAGIYYPKKVNIEQTSSEITAAYKASLVSGEKLIDITGGFGVDAFYFSKKFKQIIHCEIDPKLSEIANYNFKQLGKSNITCLNTDGIEYLKKNAGPFNWIYADPSRRKQQQKVFMLSDSVPDIPANLELLLSHSSNILLKLSPVLDIKAAINELKFVKSVHVVAVENEVKELLFIIEEDFKQPHETIAVNIVKDQPVIFKQMNLTDKKITFSEPLTYLYEPNAAILKAGLFNEVSVQFKLHKLHKNSHLYTSDKLIDFPGRRFIIKRTAKYRKKELRAALPSLKAHITTRNFPDSVNSIRKRTGIKEGGNHYLFFTTALSGQKIVLITEKV